MGKQDRKKLLFILIVVLLIAAIITGGIVLLKMREYEVGTDFYKGLRPERVVP